MSEQTGVGAYMPIAILVAVVLVLGVVIYLWLRPDPKMALIWGIAALVGTAVPAALMMKWNRQAEFQASLLREGVKGTATVISVQSTNVRIDRMHQVRMQLRVELPGQAPYEQETLQLVPFGQSAAPGRTLFIHVDPHDRNRLLLNWEGPAPEAAPSSATNAPTLADRLSALDQARQKGLISEQEYRDQRQRLLAEH
ncbi:MAG: hypothetical protein K0Q76_2741 [Panacagrimonas sp.]|nr:SHOCT domain-containing protein [Panacagrimonas sp.]MCC2657633.1 hypothetical protein [Panacagrimonas sp.]